MIDATNSTYHLHDRGDKRKALDLFNQGQAIRKELGLDGVLEAAYPQYAQIAEQYPVALHARSKKGEVLLVQRPGKLDVGKLKAAGVERQDVVRYFMYHLEFALHKIDPNAKVVMVIDMADLGLLKLANADFLGTIRDVSNTLGAVYCRKVNHYVVANPPSIFNTLWKILVTVLPAGAADNLTVCENAQALEAIMESHLVPQEMGGNLPLGEAEEHKQLKAHLASKQ